MSVTQPFSGYIPATRKKDAPIDPPAADQSGHPALRQVWPYVQPHPLAMDHHARAVVGPLVELLGRFQRWDDAAGAGGVAELGAPVGGMDSVILVEVHHPGG